MAKHISKVQKANDCQNACMISQIINNNSLSKKGVHVYYAFYETEKYIHNAVNFISVGIDQGDKILVLEKHDIHEAIIAKLILRGYKQNDIDSVMFVVNDQFYLLNNRFDVETSVKNLEETLTQYRAEGFFIRIWGQVSFKMDEPILSKLKSYECECDIMIENKMVAICTYNGLSVPSYIQNEMLKTHQYFMTDDQIRVSPFYDTKKYNILSSKEQERIRKLDKEISNLQTKNQELQNVNDKIKMKQAIIEESEKFYRNLLNELPITILITKNDHIVYINQTGRKKLNSTYVQGRKFPELFDRISTISTNGLSEYKFVLEEQAVKYFDIKSIPIWFEGETAILYVLIDLTQQKMNEKLVVQSEKLNIAGELAAGIAHEIRNPLTAIKGFIQLMEHTSNHHFLEIVNDELTRIEQISSELLMLAKPHLDTFKTIHLISLLKNVITLLATQAILKNIDINLETEEENIYINCEDTKIRQVFINLIKNAIEVMENGKILIQVTKHKEKVQVDIIDEGYGISPELLKKIGEPFYTTKDKGTGLGLMICYKIVKSHDGEIHVTSQKGLGTTFSVTLPLSTFD